ncbi:MAG: hypothetical protein R3E62_04245 [Pseudomonadales bacterium]
MNKVSFKSKDGADICIYRTKSNNVHVQVNSVNGKTHEAVFKGALAAHGPTHKTGKLKITLNDDDETQIVIPKKLREDVIWLYEETYQLKEENRQIVHFKTEEELLNYLETVDHHSEMFTRNDEYCAYIYNQ